MAREKSQRRFVQTVERNFSATHKAFLRTVERQVYSDDSTFCCDDCLGHKLDLERIGSINLEGCYFSLINLSQYIV